MTPPRVRRRRRRVLHPVHLRNHGQAERRDAHQSLYIHTAALCRALPAAHPVSRFISAAPFFHCSGTMHAITVCLHRRLHAEFDLGVGPGTFPRRDAAASLRRVTHFLSATSWRSARPRARPRSRLQVAHDIGTPRLSRALARRVRHRRHLQHLRHDRDRRALHDVVSGRSARKAHCRQRAAAAGQSGAHRAIRTPARRCPPARRRDPDEGPDDHAGILNRPEANAAAFTADGWLRSGDLGTLTRDGELAIWRGKEIIRVGGENLAPAEVEQAFRDASRRAAGLRARHSRRAPRRGAGGGRRRRAAPTGRGAARAARHASPGSRFRRPIYTADALPMTATNRVQRAVLREWIVSGKLERVA